MSTVEGKLRHGGAGRASATRQRLRQLRQPRQLRHLRHLRQLREPRCIHQATPIVGPSRHCLWHVAVDDGNVGADGSDASGDLAHLPNA